MNTAINAQGQIVHIENVQSGKQSNLLCECCNAVVVAKKGDINAHHFAHLQGEGCEYSRLGGEGILHMAAKRIIKERGEILLPKSRLDIVGSVNTSTGETLCKYKMLVDWRMYKADSVKLEVRRRGYIPDLQVTVNGRLFAVEIFVSHKVGGKKAKMFVRDNLPCIEIRLPADTPVDMIEGYLFSDWKGYDYRWIHNAKVEVHKELSRNKDWNTYWRQKYYWT